MTRRAGQRKKYIFCYTIVWACLMAVWMWCFYAQGKMPLWKHDGLSQHWNVLTYYGQWLRQIAHSIFVEHRFELPMWEMSIGAGGDILTTFHYYTIGDPLNLLSAFVPARYTQWLYLFLVLLRIYLSGLSFSAYCFYHKNRFDAVLLGSIVCTFMGYMLFYSVRHPYFINPLIYLPLLLIGIEKIYRRERPFLFIVMTAISALSNFYFFYMLCIFMFLYAAFAYFALFDRRSVRDVLCWFARFLGYFLVGFAISLVLVLPVLMTIFGTGRFHAPNYVPLLYESSYYRRYLFQIIEPCGNGIYLCFAALAPAACFYLVVKKRTRRQNCLLGGLALLVLFTLIPFCGHVINGVSYVSNRWVWALGMLAAFILADVYPEMIRMRKKELALFLLISAVYLAGCCALTNRSLSDIQAVLLFAAAVLFLLAVNALRGRVRPGLVTLAAVLLLTANISGNIFDRYLPMWRNLRDYTDFGKADENAEKRQTETAVAEVEDDSFWRYDEENPRAIRNMSLRFGLNGVQAYYSLASPVVSEFFTEIWKNEPMEQIWTDLDESSFLEKLFCVKYFAAGGMKQAYIPSMFDRQILEKGTVRVCEDEEALPLGYTYSSWIPRADYERMTAPQKRQALLQGAVLEESRLPECAPDFSDREIGFRVSPKKSVKIVSDNRWKVTGKDDSAEILSEEERGGGYNPKKKRAGCVVLEIPDPPAKSEGETYLVIENLQYEGKYDDTPITVQNSSFTKELDFRTPENPFYGGRHNFMINLGEGTLEDGKLFLYFERRGTYSFDKLSLVVQPLDELPEMTAALSEDVMENISVEDNRIAGEITLDERKLLCIAVPYSKGWKVRVDGEERTPVCVNTVFTGLELEPGYHEIRMDYCTPWLKTGAVCSLLGFAALLYLAVLWRGRRRR